jgi:hypothetical protein
MHDILIRCAVSGFNSVDYLYKGAEEVLAVSRFVHSHKAVEETRTTELHKFQKKELIFGRCM